MNTLHTPEPWTVKDGFIGSQKFPAFVKEHHYPETTVPELVKALAVLADAYVEHCQLETGKDGEKDQEVISARAILSKITTPCAS